MKRGQALLMLAAAAGLIYVLTHKGQDSGAGGAGGMSGSTGSNFPFAAVALSDSTKTSTESPAYQSAVTRFLNAPVNTTESIQGGIDVINTGYGSLPRMSQTIIQPTITPTGTTGGVAALLSTGTLVGITTTNRGSIPEPSGYVAQPGRVPAVGELTPSGNQRYW